MILIAQHKILTIETARRTRMVGLWAIVLMFGLSSCFKEPNMLPPVDQDYGQIAIIPMTPTYQEQFFFSLATNSIVKQNSRFAYDLMFDCEAGKFNIWLNTAKMMSVKHTGKTDIDSVRLSDTLNGTWKYEFGAFNRDSNAIGKWWDNSSLTQPVSVGQVYLVSLGVDPEGYGLGYVKMKVNNFNGTSYSITWSDFVLPPQTLLIAKDDTRNYKYLSFAGSNAQILDDIEPAKADWDLCFTRYTIFFYAPYNIPYEVTGVLQNPSRVQAYMDSTLKFDTITISSFNETRLLTRRDAVGYEWKRYSTLNANGTYSLNPHYTYYIKADEDQFYKLHFYSFELDGVRGYPSIEFYRI